MSKFYGQVVGDRGAATRGGYHRIKASAQSYDGSVITELTYNNEGKLMVDVCVGKDESTSMGSRIFYGTFEEYVAKLEA
jgi:hypothetical protein